MAPNRYIELYTWIELTPISEAGNLVMQVRRTFTRNGRRVSE
jgi:hypothetical protein